MLNFTTPGIVLAQAFTPDMAEKKKIKKQIREKQSGAGKPVSLWGASFTAILDALLKTKPMA